jgi:hypothetical protein
VFVCLFICDSQPVALLVRKAGKEGLEPGPENGQPLALLDGKAGNEAADQRLGIEGLEPGPENGQPVALLDGKAGNEAADQRLGIEGLEPGPENGQQREVLVTLDKGSAGTLMRFSSLVHLLKNAMVEPDVDALRKLIAGKIC